MQTLCHSRGSRANICPECRATSRQEADMTPRIPENISTWLVDWSLVAIVDDTMPPRDPNDDDEDHD
jgi:hypothetical protein